MKISICIPAYKARHFIRETLESVRAQSFHDWELIVTEDGSDDGTEQIVNDFAASVLQPVRYSRHQRNEGLPATRNSGFHAARHEWIAMLDSDDLWTPDHLSSLISTQIRSHAEFVFASSQIFDNESGRFLEVRGASVEQMTMPGAALFRGDLIIQPSSVLLNRQLITKFGGFSPAYSICNDLEYWLRLAAVKTTFAHSGHATCHYRKHAGAMSMKTAHLIAEVGLIRRVYTGLVELQIREARWLSAKAYWNAARISRRSEPWRAAGWIAQAVRSLLVKMFL